MKNDIYHSNNVAGLSIKFVEEKDGRVYFIVSGINESLPSKLFYEAYTKEY